MLNKVILLLNAIVLVVTFVLVLAGQSQQAELATSMTGGIGRGAVARGAPTNAPGSLRLLQSLEQFAPREKIDALSGAQVRALFEALDHHAWLLEEGMEDLRRRGEDGAQTRAAVEELGKVIRSPVQGILEKQFRDAGFVGRATAAIFRGG